MKPRIKAGLFLLLLLLSPPARLMWKLSAANPFTHPTKSR